MTDFKEYIDKNPEILDDLELPEGHEERFEAKLDALMITGHKSEALGAAERHRRLVRRFSVLTAAAAAVIAAVIFINRPYGEVDWFADVTTDDPAEVYLAYSEKATSMYREILTKDIDGRWGMTAGSVAEETVPMIDLLPEELDDAAKAAILKEYYGKLLNGLNKINKIKEL